MSKYLFDVQQKNRLEQKGLLRRFSITCYGHQESVEEMRAHKAEKYKELKERGDPAAFEELFLNYKPSDLINKKSDGVKKERKVKKAKTNTKTKKTKTKKTKKAKKAKLLAIYGGRTARRR